MVLASILMGILTGLIVNGLTTLVSYGIPKVKNIIKYKGDIRKALEDDETVVSNIREVVASIAKTEPFSSNELLSGRVQSFLESPTAESIVRQIYSDYMIAKGVKKSAKQLQEEFKICLANHLGTDVKTVEDAATELFEVILNGCHRALDLAINKGILPAHEAKSIARHRVLLDELHAIRGNLDFLTAHSRLDLNAIEDFEKQYRHQVAIRQKQITIPHFDRAPMVDINDIFVAPNFVCPLEHKREEHEIISLNDFLSKLYRSVLLGDPGGGKSTLAQKISYELCTNYDQRVIGHRLLTPVLIILREYSTKKKKDGSSIIQFIESEVTSKYQLPREAPFVAFEYLLHNGHLLVIFDGLDELLDPGYRREVSRDIELFCELFPSVPVLVTSRVVGYEQAPLNPDIFATFHLAPFTDEQVSEYVNKWFKNDPTSTLTPDERKRRGEAFLLESETVSDLRSNPLMLALMCNLYRGAGFIPRNRPEVYKKCSEMLFERWDPSRGIWVHLPISEPKVLLGHLAHWVYSDESLQSGVAEDILVKEASQFLYPRRFEAEEQAEKASKEFIEFCRGRAWVFTDVGTTATGVPLYKFTHKTFLEYFTATHIVRNNNSPEKLWRLLGSKVAQRAWDIVAQLAFQMLHDQVEGASDEIFTLLIKDARERKGGRWQYLSFGARCLRFVYPSPKTIRNLTEACVRRLVQDARPPVSNRRERRFHPHYAEPEELVEALLLAAPECRSIVANSLENEIVNVVNIGDDEEAARAIDLGLMLDFPLRLAMRASPFGDELQNYWNAVENRIFARIDARLEALAPHNFMVFLHWSRRHDRPFKKLFEWYTPNHLFWGQQHLVFQNVFHGPIADTILGLSAGLGIPMEQPMVEMMEATSKDAATIAELLLKREMPCFSREAMLSGSHWHSRPRHLLERWFPRRLKSKEGPLVKVPISGSAVIGFWCLWAALAEMIDDQKELVSSLREAGSPVTKLIADIVEARIQKTTPDYVLRDLASFNPPSNAMEFVRRWITGQVSFVAP